jgi:O-antigen/teichoic acid export membrane protein
VISQFLKSGSGVFLADLAGKAFGFFLISALTFILAPEELGKYNAMFTAAVSLYAFSGWGVPIVLQRQSATSDTAQKKTLGELIAAGIIIMLIAMLILMSVLLLLSEKAWQEVFPGLDKRFLLWVPVLTLGYFLVQSPLSILLGMGKFKIYSLRAATEAAITLLSVATCAYLWGLRGAIIGLFISLCLNILITIVIFYKLFNVERIRLSLGHFKQNVKRILGQGSPYFFGNTLIGSVANIVMVSLFANHIGYDDFGYLRVALSITAIMAVIPNAAKTVTITYIARFDKAAEFMKSLQIRYLFFVLIICTAVMSLILYPVVSLLFGDSYMNGLPVYRMVLYLNIIFNMHQILNGFIVGHGHLRYSGILSTVMVILYMALMYLLIPLIGISGYYVAFGACYLLGLLVLVRKEMTEENYEGSAKLRSAFLGSLGFVLCLICSLLLPIDELWRTILEASLLIIYGILHIRYVLPVGEITRIRTALKARLKLS